MPLYATLAVAVVDLQNRGIAIRRDRLRYSTPL
jgi:hypothetical protein